MNKMVKFPHCTHSACIKCYIKIFYGGDEYYMKQYLQDNDGDSSDFIMTSTEEADMLKELEQYDEDEDDNDNNNNSNDNNSNNSNDDEDNYQEQNIPNRTCPICREKLTPDKWWQKKT